jgi:hypothetical protein
VTNKEYDRDSDQDNLLKRTLLLDAKVVGFTFGLIFGIVIFLATNWLVLKGGSPVGPNLQLLSQYFIGYRVSFAGSLIGFLYGFALGTICGTLTGWLYNKITFMKNLWK